jgi:hypothetical protein
LLSRELRLQVQSTLNRHGGRDSTALKFDRLNQAFVAAVQARRICASAPP